MRDRPDAKRLEREMATGSIWISLFMKVLDQEAMQTAADSFLCVRRFPKVCGGSGSSRDDVQPQLPQKRDENRGVLPWERQTHEMNTPQITMTTVTSFI
ncbi:hypothetical protein EYF80_018936 [Liparis tanakae]|uniref:Uncharacterized protein n=1 Tax=Liparis tanakae TaxID=230148 RepID=A0A4Z2I0N9_9TELE|nr:hypothetical protein EYF80_018936 [Liparis tanakae]